jgi:tetratricopeptide (TPR) repeat protein/DNA-binding SARP family transcriptional activator
VARVVGHRGVNGAADVGVHQQAATSVRFSVLGPVRAWRAGTELDLGPRHLRSILALLLVRAGQPVAPATIAGLLWDQEPPARAEEVVDGYVAELRRILHSAHALKRHPEGYRLRINSHSLDLLAFRRLTGLARRALDVDGEAAAVPLYTEALRLWHGRCAAGLEPASALHPAFVAVARERSAAAREAADAALQCGAAHEVLDVVDEAARDDSHDEPLQARLRQLVAAGSRPEPRDTQSAEALDVRRPAQLPATLRLFSGRQSELAALTALLSDNTGDSVLTVVIDGPPGIGKSTLAVQWAQAVAPSFPDGQLFVNLRGFDALGQVAEPGEALTDFLSSIGVPYRDIPADLQAKSALFRTMTAGRRMLVVADNARDAEQVRPLIPGSAGCLVIVTSRNRLAGLHARDGAHLLTLDLPTLDDARESLRRRLGDTRVAGDPAALDDIIDGCGRLPLAMAIITARAAANPAVPLAEIAREIRGNRTNLDVFTGDDPTLDLRAVCSWSYRLLSEPAARLFRLLSLHPGPDFSVPTLASLAGIATGEVAGVLAELRRTRLLTEHWPGRYVFHDLIRVYAMELTGAVEPESERRRALCRFVDHLLLTAHAANDFLMPSLRLTPPAGCSDGVAAEPVTDVAAALDWFAAELSVVEATIAGVRHDGFQPWRLALTLMTYYERTGRYQAWGATATVALDAATAAGDTLGEAHIHRMLAGARTFSGDHAAAAEHLRRAIVLFERAGLAAERGYAMCNLGTVEHNQNRFDAAIAHYQNAVDLFTTIEHESGRATALYGMSYCLARLGRYEETLETLKTAYGIFGAFGNEHEQAGTLNVTASVYHRLGRYDESTEHRMEAIRILASTGDQVHYVEAYTDLGGNYAEIGRYDDAEQAFRHALAVALDAGLTKHARLVRTSLDLLRQRM